VVEDGVSEVTLTQADNGKTVEVAPGDVVVVRLPENPTTGYRWAQHASTEPVLAPREGDFTPAAGAGVGGGGRKTFRFAATGAGDVHLQLKLWREWEGDPSVAERFQATIRVRA
jgi:inhibitor of cysteine peptidase